MGSLLGDESRRDLTLERVLPVSLLALLYIMDMATDIAAAVQLHWVGSIWGSCMSAFFICLPILVFNVHEAITTIMRHKCSSQRALMRVVQLLFCPFVGLLRYGERVFWLVEAVTVQTESERELALLRADEPRRIELYLFLRPILQAVPQSCLQMLLLVYIGKVEIRLIQALSMITSIISFSVIAASYQRFESQEDKTLPWIYQEPQAKQIKTSKDTDDKKTVDFTSNKDEHKQLLKPQTSLQDFRTKVSADIHIRGQPPQSNTLPPKFRYANTTATESSTDEPLVTNRNNSPAVFARPNPPDVVQINNSGESPPPPIPPRNSGLIFAPARPPSKLLHSAEADKIQLSDIQDRNSRVSFLRHSYAESSLTSSFSDNRRSSYHYLQINVSDSSNRSSEIKVMSVPDFVAPPVPKPVPVDPLIVALPTRKMGKKYVNTDSPMAYCVILLKWFLFIVSRLIAFGGLFALAYNSLILMLVTLGCFIGHVIVMYTVITVNSNRTITNWWRSYILSFTSLYALLEIGVKFEKITRIMVIYWPLCFIENIAAAFIAYRPDQITNIANWWFAYLFYTMLSTYILSAACFLFNTYILSPKSYVLYEE